MVRLKQVETIKAVLIPGRGGASTYHFTDVTFDLFLSDNERWVTISSKDKSAIGMFTHDVAVGNISFVERMPKPMEKPAEAKK